MNYKTELRITKYDPQYRNEIGTYLRDEWYLISQIGDTFDGKVFTSSDYFDAEDRYIESLKILLKAYDITEMAIDRGGDWRAFANYGTYKAIPYDVPQIKPIISFSELYKYMADDSGAEIHIPRQSISDDTIARWTSWEPIPQWFFTNNQKFSLSDEFIASLCEGRICTIEEIEILSRLNLRGDFWCSFYGPNSSYIHFGWDYYMYFGGDFDCDISKLVFPMGIFVESSPSPCFPDDDE